MIKTTVNQGLPFIKKKGERKKIGKRCFYAPKMPEKKNADQYMIECSDWSQAGCIENIYRYV